MSRYVKKRKMPKGLLIFLIVFACIVVLGGAAIGALYAKTHISGNKICENVTIAGINVGGMTKDEATSAVHSAMERNFSKQSMQITVLDDKYEISPSVSEAKLDVEGIVNAAYGYGRTGFVLQRYKEQKKASETPVNIDIQNYLTLNNAAVQAEVDTISAQYNQPMVGHAYRFDGQMPSEGNMSGNRTLILTKGQTGLSLDSAALYQQVLDAYYKSTFTVNANCITEEPAALDFDTIIKENTIAPVDAVMDKTTKKITTHSSGYGITVTEAKDAFNECASGKEVSIAFHTLEPKVTVADLEKDLFPDLLSEYTAKYGSSANRDVNLKLSTAAINGITLYPGDVFDYNSTLGERTPEAGYRLGNSYMGMETIQTYGGGICQTSSTLYYCVLMADLEIVTRTNHGFISDYVPFGMDATVSWGGPEFRFKNNTQNPIRIEAFSEGGNVTVRLWGIDDKEYYVKMEYEVLGTYGWKTVEQEMAPDNSKGYKDGQVITTPYTGYKIQTYRCKYNKTTDELISKEPEALSSYSTRNKVVCKIVDKKAEADKEADNSTETTTPPATTEAPTKPAEPTTPPATEPTTTPPTTEATEPTTTEPTVPPASSGSGPVTEDG